MSLWKKCLKHKCSEKFKLILMNKLMIVHAHPAAWILDRQTTYNPQQFKIVCLFTKCCVCPPRDTALAEFQNTLERLVAENKELERKLGNSLHNKSLDSSVNTNNKVNRSIILCRYMLSCSFHC